MHNLNKSPSEVIFSYKLPNVIWIQSKLLNPCYSNGSGLWFGMGIL